MKQLDFNMTLYYHNIMLMGNQGEGKTHKARKILDIYPNVERWIWSPQRPLENFEGYGEEATRLEELDGGGFKIWNGDYSEKTFAKFQTLAMKQKDLWLIIDDAHEQCTKQMLSAEWKTTILSGRNRGIFSMFLTPHPNQIHNTILGSCQHTFAFKLGLESHIEWVRKNIMGDEAWILLPSTQRKVNKEEWPDVLPSRSYLYRDRSQDQNQLMIAGEDFVVNG